MPVVARKFCASKRFQPDAGDTSACRGPQAFGSPLQLAIRQRPTHQAVINRYETRMEFSIRVGQLTVFACLGLSVAHAHARYYCLPLLLAHSFQAERLRGSHRLMPCSVPFQ